MAYNVEKLAKLGALKELGLKQKAVDEAQNKRSRLWRMSAHRPTSWRALR